MDYDDFQQKNPNLYLTLAESVESGYILAENGNTLLTESFADILSYGQ